MFVFVCVFACVAFLVLKVALEVLRKVAREGAWQLLEAELTRTPKDHGTLLLVLRLLCLALHLYSSHLYTL